jgi:tocopherol O-methyltransferase
MIECPTVTKNEIRQHYDLATLFYRLLWGQHIHHGLWEASESPKLAQRRLTEKLAELALVQPGDRVLDVGCGMGGSSIHLAKHMQCQTTGVTISRLQRLWATTSAWMNGVSKRSRFLCSDAEQVSFAPGEFDIVWSVECTEHLFDKPRFFQRAAKWLRPGGRMAICAWLAGNSDAAEHDRKVFDVCEGFLCPSLGTRDDYSTWMQNAGLERVCYHDWTDRVSQTWEICMDRVRRTGIPWLARRIDRNMGCFLDRFETILDAYRSGAMQYGCFVFRAPDALHS